MKVGVSSRGSGLPGADLQLGLGAFSRNLTMPKRIGQNTVEGVAGQPHPNDPVEDLEIEDTFSSSGRLLEDSEVPGDGCRDPGAQRVAGVRGHPVVDLVDRVE